MTDRTRPFPLVSVALVTYNQEQFLAEAVESVLAQDYPRLELIVADDCSTDGTFRYLDKLEAAGDERIRVLRAPHNRGVTANHAVALEACQGHYISWMAGDDVMLPGKISAQVALMEAEPNCAICYHDLEMFGSDEGFATGRYSELDPPREGGIEVLVRYGAINGGSSNLVRSTVAPAFHPGITISSDWLWYVECLAGGGRIRYIPRVYGRYRRHCGNVTATQTRSPSRALLEQHLQSCAIILARRPDLAPHVRARSAALLRQQRWDDEGRFYGSWLKASLTARFSFRVLAALWADRLLGWRR